MKKYNWSLRKHWKSWFLSDISRFWYKLKYKIEFGFNGSMLPKTGKGKFVSVYRKGDYIDIINEKDSNFIRLIPYKPNHGIMVEKWVNNKLKSRNLLCYEQLSKDVIFSSNVEQLTKRK